MLPTRAAPHHDGEAAFWPTLGELLDTPELALVPTSGPGGENRRIRIVLTTELIDTTPFLRGGEVLLTTGLAWGAEGTAARFVRSAHRAGVVGVGFGTGPWRQAVPEDLLAAARGAGIPVFEVPPSTPFMAIAEQVAAEQAARRAHHTEQVMVGALMDHVRRGQADPAVLDDHAPFLYPRASGTAASTGPAGRQLLAVACHADDGVASEPAKGRILVGRRDRRVLVLGDEPAVRWYVESRGIGVYGWGEAAGARELRRILGEAWSAYEVARKRGRPAAARDLASVGGLVARLTGEQLAPFEDHVLEPLRRHDAIHGTELYATVEAFVRVRGSLAETGQVLFLHVNTVRKRMTRVGSLLGLDPLDPEGYLVLHLAVQSAARDR